MERTLTQSFTKLVFLLFIVLPLSLFASWCQADVAVTIWQWFMVPSGYACLPFSVALGAGVLYSLIRGTTTADVRASHENAEDNKKEGYGAELASAFNNVLIRFGVTYGILLDAWLLKKLFM